MGSYGRRIVKINFRSDKDGGRSTNLQPLNR